METFETYLNRVKNPEAVIRLLFNHLERHSNPPLLRTTLLRLGPIGFYLATDKKDRDTAEDVFIGTAKPHPLQGAEHPTSVLRRGTILITFGKEALQNFDDAETYDLLMVLMEMSTEEAQEFLQTCLRQIVGYYKDQQLDPRLAAGFLHVSRICLAPNELLAKEVQALFLLECIKHLDFSALWRFAEDKGDDPLKELTRNDRIHPDRFGGKMLQYALKQTEELAQELAVEFPDLRLYRYHAFKTSLKVNRARFIERPGLLREFLIVAKCKHNMSLCDQMDEFVSSYGQVLLQQVVGQPGARHDLTVVTELARDFKLWYGISEGTFEESFLNLLANGGFAEAWRFVCATRCSSFLRDVQLPTSEEDPTRNEMFSEASERVQRYVLANMRRIIARALEIGRVDVVYLLSRYYQRELNIPDEDIEALLVLVQTFEGREIIRAAIDELSAMLVGRVFPKSKFALDEEAREVEETTS